jgi:radical SAM family uncharacterized protein/radical SAM-linked protein
MLTEKELDLILPYVERPARYINAELNTYKPDMNADFSLCLAFPDIYEVGASNLGLEILYHLVNEKKLARCERVYAPDTDLEKILREKKIELFSLESKSFLKTFDIVGFSIQCELVATNIVNMLDLANIPVFASERSDSAPLIIAGGPALTNPEPFCDFFDLFVLGDGEEVLEEIITLAKECKKSAKSRRETLEVLSQIQGVYVPSFYNVSYNADGTVNAIKPNNTKAPETVYKRVSDLNKIYFPQRKIVPFIQTVHNRVNIEVARGCIGRCRFCQASKYYRPWRERSEEHLLNLLDKNLMSSGYDEVAFSSLSCSDYRHLKTLLIETNTRYASRKINISLPSMRCNSFSIVAAKYISRDKRPTLTFAPEAATDRLRNVIGKYLSEAEIVQTLLSGFSLGWRVIKLYFMIGLPTETDEDILSIGKLVKSVRAQAKGLNFSITVSPFVPKAQTAFQWAAMNAPDEIKGKIALLRRLPADIRAHNSASSIIEALLAKGDRRLSEVIYKVWQKGARLDQWAEKFNFNFWNEAITECGLNLDFYVYRQRKESEVFPWDHLNFGFSKEDLYKDYVKGLSENCAPASFTGEESNFPENASPVQTAPQEPKMKVRLRFSREGLVKYISHLDQIDALRRAVIRSGVEACFTAGFSPQVKISFGPAISVGYESNAELADLYLSAVVDTAEILNKINAVLPRGYKLLSAARIPLNFPSAEVSCNVIEYAISGVNITREEIEKFLSRESIPVVKEKKGKSFEIDAKPLIINLEPFENGLRLTLKLETGKNLKPENILKKLLENQENYGKIIKIKRLNLYAMAKNGNVYEL